MDLVKAVVKRIQEGGEKAWVDLDDKFISCKWQPIHAIYEWCRKLRADFSWVEPKRISAECQGSGVAEKFRMGN